MRWIFRFMPIPGSNGASFEGMYPRELTNTHDLTSCQASKVWYFRRENPVGCNLVAMGNRNFTRERLKS